MVELDLTKVGDNSAKVDDVTLAEVYEALSKDLNDHDIAIESSPFPHVELTRSFGVVIILDADNNWLDNKITITTISVRCVYNTHKYKVDLNNSLVKDFNIKKLERDNKIQAEIHIHKQTTISEVSERIFRLIAYFGEITDQQPDLTKHG